MLRIPLAGEVRAEELHASTAFYPLVGLGVGAVPAATLFLPLPPIPRAALALTLWVVVTGAFHLDGWADVCDAAFTPELENLEATRVRRLEILRDPQIGTFGAAGVGLLLLLKWSAISHVSPFAPLVAAPIARWTMVWTLRCVPPARDDGLGATLAGPACLGWATTTLVASLGCVIWAVSRPGWLTLEASTVGTEAVFSAVTTTVGGGAVLTIGSAALVGGVAAIAMARALAHRFGGFTGDVCGAVGEGAELVVLWVFLVMGPG